MFIQKKGENYILKAWVMGKRSEVISCRDSYFIKYIINRIIQL